MLFSRNSFSPKNLAPFANLLMFTRNPGFWSIVMNDDVPFRFTPIGP